MAEPAAIAETHISVVTFIGDRAFKLKKPVATDFLDFSTRELRLDACRREVELNRRLAPDVYLGVADVSGVDGTLEDHLVVMRRMPTDRRLATLVAEGDPAVEVHLRAVARLLVDFHSRAERSVEIDQRASATSVRADWEQNLAELAPFVGDLLDGDKVARVGGLVDRFLAGRDELFARRVADGHVCDGHGDLQAADIFCLDDGPRVLDCIEFSDVLRHADVLADVAFLAMDLDRLGAADLGAGFVAAYREFAGSPCPSSLLEHYIAARALVRCKVACLRVVQEQRDDTTPGGVVGAPEQRGEAEDDLSAQQREADADVAERLGEARRLLQMALRYLERARVRVVLVGGLPGTGKSTLAKGLGDRFGWTVLRSDEIRKELAGVPTTDHRGAAFGEGIYDAEVSRDVYAELLRRTATAIRSGESVVLDASWSNDGERLAAARCATEAVADFVEIECVVDTDVAAGRLSRRLAVGVDPSDATPEVADRLAEVADPWERAITIDTQGDEADTLTRAIAALGLGHDIADVVSG